MLPMSILSYPEDLLTRGIPHNYGRDSNPHKRIYTRDRQEFS